MTCVTGAEIEAEARRWLGTPFHHQGRLLGVGVDCVGLVVMVARALRMRPDFQDRGDYSRIPNKELELLLDEQLTRIRDKSQRRVGDVIVFAWGRELQHLGIWTAAGTVIHSYGINGRGKVVETHLTGPHADRQRRVYRFPEACD